MEHRLFSEIAKIVIQSIYSNKWVCSSYEVIIVVVVAYILEKSLFTYLPILGYKIVGAVVEVVFYSILKIIKSVKSVINKSAC